MSSPPVIFLDTNILLDYLENRDKEVKNLLKKLIRLHRRGKIILATSIFNIVELIDKEFEISFLGWCQRKRLSPDEAYRRVRAKGDRLFLQVAEDKRERIKSKISKFIEDNDILLLSFSSNDERGCDNVFNVVYEYKLSSQDALIVATAVINGVNYFLSNDNELITKVDSLFNCFNLRDERQRRVFNDNVLKVL